MTAPRPVLLFDGDCAFCTSAVGVVERLRRAPGDFAVLPWQRADLPAYGLSPQRCSEALQWVGADGRASSAQDAVARCLRSCRSWVRPVGVLLLAPGVNALAGVAYRWVAANRSRLPGGTPACSL